jgi:EAL domain-containing protein (putative c-di-GMP-specific phosphodiesterase class I)
MQGYYFSRPLPPEVLMQQELLTADGSEAVDFSTSAYASCV